MLLPDDILYTLCDYLTYADYLSCSSWFHPNLQISRRKRFEWCSSRIRLHPLKRAYCSDVQCSRQRMSCIELEPLHTRILSMYCAAHTREYYMVDSILDLVQV